MPTALGIEADFIIPGIETEAWLITPIHELMLQGRSTHGWLGKILQPPIERNTHSNFDFIPYAKDDL